MIPFRVRSKYNDAEGEAKAVITQPNAASLLVVWDDGSVAQVALQNVTALVEDPTAAETDTAPSGEPTATAPTSAGRRKRA